MTVVPGSRPVVVAHRARPTSSVPASRSTVAGWPTTSSRGRRRTSATPPSADTRTTFRSSASISWPAATSLAMARTGFRSPAFIQSTTKASAEPEGEQHGERAPATTAAGGRRRARATAPARSAGAGVRGKGRGHGGAVSVVSGARVVAQPPAAGRAPATSSSPGPGQDRLGRVARPGVVVVGQQHHAVAGGRAAAVVGRQQHVAAGVAAVVDEHHAPLDGDRLVRLRPRAGPVPGPAPRPAGGAAATRPTASAGQLQLPARVDEVGVAEAAAVGLGQPWLIWKISCQRKGSPRCRSAMSHSVSRRCTS